MLIYLNKYLSLSNQLGEKAKGLFSLVQLGIPIPPSIVTSVQFMRQMDDYGKLTSIQRDFCKTVLRKLVLHPRSPTEELLLLILRFGEKRLQPWLPKSLPHLGLSRELCVSPQLKNMWFEQRNHLSAMFPNGVPIQWENILANGYAESFDTFAEAIIDLLEASYLRLDQIKKCQNKETDTTIIIQKELNIIMFESGKVMISGMAYSSDPYGEKVDDYGRYRQCFPDINDKKHDLFEMRLSHPILYGLLKDNLQKIDIHYKGEPRYIEFIIIDNNLWFLQNRRKWRPLKRIQHL